MDEERVARNSIGHSAVVDVLVTDVRNLARVRQMRTIRRLRRRKTSLLILFYVRRRICSYILAKT